MSFFNFRNKEIESFEFRSTYHKRYEHGNNIIGNQECTQGRTISVEKNINGCKGYRLTPGKGYIVRIYNDSLHTQTMSPKPMLIVSKTSNKIELRGFPIEAQGPFGWVEVDYRDYGLTIYYKDGEVDKCVLHMFDRNIDIEYLTDEVELLDDKTITKELDTYDLKAYNVDNFDFTSHNFVEYENGKIKSKGNAIVKIIVNNEYRYNKYSVSVLGNGIKDKINLEFEFDACMGCNDRLLLYSLPKETNANIIVMTVLQNICHCTRNLKIYSATEPVVCSIFTSKGHLVKLSFTFANPERLLEFYL